MKRIVTGFVLVILAVAVLFNTQPLSAADTDFIIYFENSTLALKSQTIDRTVYLPLQEIVRHLGLASTDATGVVTFTIQGQNSRLVLTPGSALSYNDQSILLQNPIRRDDGQWLVPLDFLSQGLSRVAGVEFRYKPGTRRVFAGKVTTTELAMTAQSLGALTRLTLRAGSPIEVDLQKETAQRRAVLVLKGRAIDPARERLEYKDALVQSVVFDDSDGTPRLLIGLADDVRDVRLAASDGNRVYFVDFVREISSEATPPAVPVASAPAPARPNPNVTTGAGVRVIVIDAGHGGIETGASNSGTLEKDLTLLLARRLRMALQSRLSATIVLTRDSDIELTSEARAGVANNNQASLFISLHTGYSPDKMASGSSIYVMKPDFTGGLSEPAGGRLFFPWYMAYRTNAAASKAMAESLQMNLTQALPGWKFPIRYGPVGVLASATMPAIAIEVGNLNNDTSAKTLMDPDFQTKLTTSIAEGIEQVAGGRKQ